MTNQTNITTQRVLDLDHVGRSEIIVEISAALIDRGHDVCDVMRFREGSGDLDLEDLINIGSDLGIAFVRRNGGWWR